MMLQPLVGVAFFLGVFCLTSALLSNDTKLPEPALSSVSAWAALENCDLQTFSVSRSECEKLFKLGVDGQSRDSDKHCETFKKYRECVKKMLIVSKCVGDSKMVAQEMEKIEKNKEKGHIKCTISSDENKTPLCREDLFILGRDECERLLQISVERAAKKADKCEEALHFVTCTRRILRMTDCHHGANFTQTQSSRAVDKLRKFQLTKCFQDVIKNHRVSTPSLRLPGPLPIDWVNISQQRQCHRVDALQRFFYCGTRFHSAFKTENTASLNQRELCVSLTKYKKCAKLALEDSSCAHEKELVAQIGYFTKDALLNAGLTCDLIHPGVAAIARQRHRSLAGACQGRAALRDFFQCGLSFNREVRGVLNGPNKPNMRMLRQSNPDFALNPDSIPYVFKRDKKLEEPEERPKSFWERNFGEKDDERDASRSQSYDRRRNNREREERRVEVRKETDDTAAYGGRFSDFFNDIGPRFKGRQSSDATKELCQIIARYERCVQPLASQHQCLTEDLDNHMTFVKNAMIQTLNVKCDNLAPGGSSSLPYPTGTQGPFPPGPTGPFPPPTGHPPGPPGPAPGPPGPPPGPGGPTGGPIPPPGGYTDKTFSPGPLKDCEYNSFVRRYAYCAVAFFAEIEGQNLKPNDKKICPLVKEFNDCEDAAAAETKCNNPPHIFNHINYFTDVLLRKYKEMCGYANRHDPSKSDIGEPPLGPPGPGPSPGQKCMSKELLRRFFACGIALQASLEGSSDPCKCMNEYGVCFQRARTELGCTGLKFNADLNKYITELSAEMTVMYNLQCKTHMTFYAGVQKRKCHYHEAMRRFFLCDISYFRVIESLSTKRRNTDACHYVNEIDECLRATEYQTGCAKTELHTHAKAILLRITENERRYCPVKPDKDEASTDLVNIQRVKQGCDENAVLKKALVCAIGFQNFMDQRIAQKNTPDNEVCPFIKDFDRCIETANKGTACSYDLNLNAQLVTYKKLLEEEYGVKCSTSQMISGKVRPKKYQETNYEYENGPGPKKENLNNRKVPVHHVVNRDDAVPLKPAEKEQPRQIQNSGRLPRRHNGDPEYNSANLDADYEQPNKPAKTGRRKTKEDKDMPSVQDDEKEYYDIVGRGQPRGGDGMPQPDVGNPEQPNPINRQNKLNDETEQVNENIDESQEYNVGVANKQKPKRKHHKSAFVEKPKPVEESGESDAELSENVEPQHYRQSHLGIQNAPQIGRKKRAFSAVKNQFDSNDKPARKTKQKIIPRYENNDDDADASEDEIDAEINRFRGRGPRSKVDHLRTHTNCNVTAYQHELSKCDVPLKAEMRKLHGLRKSSKILAAEMEASKSKTCRAFATFEKCVHGAEKLHGCPVLQDKYNISFVSSILGRVFNLDCSQLTDMSRQMSHGSMPNVNSTLIGGNARNSEYKKRYVPHLMFNATYHESKAKMKPVGRGGFRKVGDVEEQHVRRRGKSNKARLSRQLDDSYDAGLNDDDAGYDDFAERQRNYVRDSKNYPDMGDGFNDDERMGSDYGLKSDSLFNYEDGNQFEGNVRSRRSQKQRQHAPKRHRGGRRRRLEDDEYFFDTQPNGESLDNPIRDMEGGLVVYQQLKQRPKYEKQLLGVDKALNIDDLFANLTIPDECVLNKLTSDVKLCNRTLLQKMKDWPPATNQMTDDETKKKVQAVICLDSQFFATCLSKAATEANCTSIVQLVLNKTADSTLQTTIAQCARLTSSTAASFLLAPISLILCFTTVLLVY